MIKFTPLRLASLISVCVIELILGFCLLDAVRRIRKIHKTNKSKTEKSNA